MTEVIDLLDSDDELPSLAARLQRRGAPAEALVPAAQRPSSPAGRPPLAAVHNQGGSGGASGGGSPGKLESLPSVLPHATTSSDAGFGLGGAEALQRRRQERAARKAAREAAAAPAVAAAVAAAEPAAADPAGFDWAAFDAAARPQYHQQEQRQQQQQQGDGSYVSPASAAAAAAAAAASGRAGAPGSGGRRGPTRGARVGAAARRAPSASLDLNGDDGEWRPPGGSQRAGPSSAAAEAGGEQPPKAKRPKRTAEEIARDKALQARDREDSKLRKQAAAQKWALQQVRVLVDAALVSSGGLGAGLLTHLDNYNARLPANAVAERRVNYQVAPLDMAPFKAIRWQRRTLVEAAGGGGGSDASQQQGLGTQASAAAAAPASQLAEQWEEAPHVMVCFQPEEFIEAVQRDRLASLFALLERRAAGQRPYLTVVGLERHVRLAEQRAHRADQRAGVAPTQRSVRPLLDEFVSELAVECPRLGFRDVVDAAQAAQHVQLLTVAIAKQPFEDSDATVWLRAHDKGDTQAMTNLLINHPLEDRALEPLARSLVALPSVKPGVAHTLATYYGSLGGLIDALLDPSRSDAEKERELANMQRAGGARAMRVGPAAARQLLGLLRSTDPNLRIKAGEEGEGGG